MDYDFNTRYPDNCKTDSSAERSEICDLTELNTVMLDMNYFVSEWKFTGGMYCIVITLHINKFMISFCTVF